MTSSIRVVVVAAAAVLSLASAGNAVAAPSKDDASVVGGAGEHRTQLQSSLQRVIDQRRAQGLPVPAHVTFEYQAGPETVAPMARRPGFGRQTTVIAKTTIHFNHPAQAGRDRWPDFVVDSTKPSGARGFTRAGDYTQQVRDKLEEEIPGIWSRYEFGHEPRTYTFTERLTVTYPDEAGAEPESETTSLGNVLMGFTFVGPDIEYLIDECLEVLDVDVACLKAGFAFDYGAGMRLPMEVGLTGTEPMLEGSSQVLSSLAQGLDWSATDYANVGVPEEAGNEFVLRLLLFVGIHVDVIGVDVVDWAIDVDEDHSSSFVTPLGPGATFSIPPFDIPLWTDDVPIVDLELGLRLTPSLGSDRFTADWTASSEASGSGGLTYTDATVPISVGPVNALDGPGSAVVQLDDFRYYFTNFDLKLQLYIYIDVFVTSGTFPIDIGEFDLGGFVQNLYVGPHSGTVGTTGITLAIDNVAPTAEIDRTGTVLVNGVPTFLAAPGQTLLFTGTAHDPGQDDLTLTWDWDDGLPSPDVSTTYPVPTDVIEAQSHQFADACLYNVTFKAVDDDGAEGQDVVPVLVLAQGVEPTAARMEGYWQHQLGQNGETDFDTAALECLLGIIGHASMVFDEVRDASTIAAAFDVLHLAQNGGSRLEQLDRELLVTWLNFAAGAFGFTELIDTDGDGISDTPFVDVMAAAELVRLDPNATDTELKRTVQFLHHMNESHVAALVAKNRATIERAEPGAAGAGSDVAVADDVATLEGLRLTRTLRKGIGISFALASPGAVDLRIFDISGRVVRTVEGTYGAGAHAMLWDGTADTGESVPSGVYFVLMRSAGQVWRAKGILVR